MLEVYIRSVLGDQQAENQIYATAIMCVVLYRLLEAHERANTALNAGQATMRDRNAVPQSSAAESFARSQA